MPKPTDSNQIISNDQVIEDNWQIIERDFDGQPAELPEGSLLLPMQFWLTHRDALTQRIETIGVWIDSDEQVEQLGEDVDKFTVIAVNFPTFGDGRGFSTARLLRDRYQYKGQLRAIGNAIRDQLFYLKRCGFDAYQLREGYDLNASTQSLNDFSVTYQASVEQPQPLFRRR